MTRFLINFSNAHWCGGDAKVVVNAETEDEARYKAEDYMEEYQRELFSDEYGDSLVEDEEYADEYASTVDSVELFDSKHPEWMYYKDLSQQSFYPEID